MGIINQMIGFATWPSFQKLRAQARDPESAQNRIWEEVHSLLAKSTYWGRQSRRRSLAEFPISDFETYRPVLEESLSEKISPLSGEEIIFWAESGRTSGSAKLFPLTERYRRQFQQTMGPYLHANARRFSGFGDRPVIYLASVLPQRRTAAGVEIGYISGFNYRHIPAPLRKLYVFPLDVFKSGESFREWAPIFAAATDISAIFAITPVKVEQFWELIWSERERILKALRKGNRVPVTAKRLRHLDNIFSQQRPYLHDLWPSLSVVGCWKTAACTLQLESLEKHLGGKTPVADAIYSATEGWVTVPLSGASGGVLHPGAHVVEFHEAGVTPDAKTLLKPWELVAGKDYEIFLTTAMGLVRYRLYDILRCTGHWQNSPILEFKRRANHQISLGTVRVTEDELITCLRQVGFVPVTPFCFAPNRHGNGLVLISAETVADEIQRRVDEALQMQNSYYARDRREGLVKAIEVLVLSADHRLWLRDTHAQEKPRVLIQEFPA